RAAAGDWASTRRQAPAAPPAPPLRAGRRPRDCTARPLEEGRPERGWDAGQPQPSRGWEPQVALPGVAVWCVAQPTWAWAPAETREPDLAHHWDGEVVPALSTANGRELLRTVL